MPLHFSVNNVLVSDHSRNRNCFNVPNQEYAAAFFLLGNSLQDAVNVCLKQLEDFQLAIALARVVEQSNEGPILFGILNRTVLPHAFREGNRWLASWAFWLLHRRDLAVRIIIVGRSFLTVFRS